MSMLLKILQRPVKIKPGLLLIDSAALIVCSSREDRIAIAARVLSMCHWEIMRGFLLKKMIVMKCQSSGLPGVLKTFDKSSLELLTSFCKSKLRHCIFNIHTRYSVGSMSLSERPQ